MKGFLLLIALVPGMLFASESLYEFRVAVKNGDYPLAVQVLKDDPSILKPLNISAFSPSEQIEVAKHENTLKHVENKILRLEDPLGYDSIELAKEVVQIYTLPIVLKFTMSKCSDLFPRKKKKYASAHEYWLGVNSAYVAAANNLISRAKVEAKRTDIVDAIYDKMIINSDENSEKFFLNLVEKNGSEKKACSRLAKNIKEGEVDFEKLVGNKLKLKRLVDTYQG